MMTNVQLSEQPDKTIWRWTPDGRYSTKSAYTMLHAGATKFEGHQLIWKTWAPLRVKIFMWLAFRRRHWTADRRRRYGLDARDNCFLCDQEQETVDHIAASCAFTRELWHLMLRLWESRPRNHSQQSDAGGDSYAHFGPANSEQVLTACSC